MAAAAKRVSKKRKSDDAEEDEKPKAKTRALTSLTLTELKDLVYVSCYVSIISYHLLYLC